jgi:thioredoxin reductase
VIDAAEPSHFAADAVHGMIGFERLPPRELRTRTWLELDEFDITHVRQFAVSAVRADNEFCVTLDDGKRVEASNVILAGGLRYAPCVDVPGLEELWGSLVFHCPFCHGWEIRGKRVAVIAANPEHAQHAATMLALWTDDVHPVVGEIAAIRKREDGRIDLLQGDAVATFDAVFCPPRFEAVDDLPEQLGLVRVPREPMVPQSVFVDSDEFGATSVPGLFVGGDLTTSMPSVPIAIASGARAGFGVARRIAMAGCNAS